ncbi:c-type cytochrome biogenesis protein CcmI [Nitrincola tapanii]|uniref:C-type cytochrome biogenesis protein CcmI n=1 Tax=Nitrincola tapanii TaxID=1708751 RepID=A0A5A9W1U7_9GAMM|nr:c-type cytochrome biogenesis protein CcmI [Nitrincola tapanii]KAA0874770.1 c-type cytochrome biogenesis protein CcmI [Nitrincola tapanii]
MISLWLGIALLTLIALAIIFWPLVKNRRHQNDEPEVDRLQQNIQIFRERLSELERERDIGTLTDEHFIELKTELERSLLIDAENQGYFSPRLVLGRAQLISIILIALILPTASFGLYSYLGRADDLARSQWMQSWDNPFAQEELNLSEALARLESELEQRPENPEGWYLLATTRMNLNAFDAAVEAFQQVLKYLPENTPEYPAVMGQLAQAMFFASAGEMTAAIEQQLQATLRLDANEVTSLGIAGIAAFEQEDYVGAITYWERALTRAEGQAAESLKNGIERARAALTGVAVDEQAVTDLVEAESEAMAALSLYLDLDESILTEITADQSVFVFARPVGERMPITAMRLRVADLPTEIRFDDRNSMLPDVRLSDFSEVDVVARISASGQPEEGPGDFKGTLSSVKVSTDTAVMRLLISERVE